MARNRSHTHRPDRRVFRRRRIAFAINLALLVGLCLFVGLSSGASAADNNGFDLSVTQCDPSTGENCTETKEELAPKPAKKKPAPTTTTVITVQPSKPKPAEVHELSLQTGKDEVTTLEGKQEEDKAALSPSLEKNVNKDNPEPDDLGMKSLPDVRTNAGSPFAGFGSGFDFVSGDEALARFAIPPFLEPIYYAAGEAYGVPWNVLAAINQIETDFGRIERQVSSAGALGWMQFMPGTWKTYGVDATGDGVADPWNPVDAIYAAARYLKASGGGTDLRKAVYAYNHADWYVDSVLKTANVYGSLPPGLVAETGSLAFGHFPVRGSVSYGDDFRRAQEARQRPDGLTIKAADGATAVATQDVTVKEIRLERRLARTLAEEQELPQYGIDLDGAAPAAPAAPVIELPLPDPVALSQLGSLIETVTGLPTAAPTGQLAKGVATAKAARMASASDAAAKASDAGAAKLDLPKGYGRTSKRGITVIVEDRLGNSYKYSGLARLAPRVRPGAKLEGEQAVGRLGDGKASQIVFTVRGAGGALVDPRPLVDGYRLQEAAGFYHVTKALGGNPFVPTLTALSASGTVSGSATELAHKVLDDSGIQIYPCGRQDIERGTIDRRVLAMLLYLRKAGLTLTITSLHCGHGYYTAGGSVSAHSYGAAVDIAAFNGQPVLGHQGPGSLTEQAIKLLMQLQGSAQPSQLISLMNFGGPSFAMGDHDDHLHVGYPFQAALGLGRSGEALGNVTFAGGTALTGVSQGKVSKKHEAAFSDKLGAIRNPRVRHEHGDGSLKVEAETPADGPSALRLAAKLVPLRVVPTSAGAVLTDVDIPYAGRGDEASAVGLVDGSGRPGWAPRQVVVLRHDTRGWSLVGPPRDARGRIVNPRLTAISAVRGGSGYAVGEKGALVLLRGARAPLALASGTKNTLRAVDARRVDGRLQGYAVGDRRTGLRLYRSAAKAERTPAALASVALDARGTVTSVSSSSLYRRSSGWSRTQTDFALPEGSSVKLTSAAVSDDGVWVAGGMSDSQTVGHAAEVPFAARLSGGSWTTWCAGSPSLAPIRELGGRRAETCNGRLTIGSVAMGPASSIAAGAKSVVVATPAGLQMLRNEDFRLVPDASASALSAGAGPAYEKLALSSGGKGWAVGTSGRLSRVTSATGLLTSVRGDGVARKLPVADGGNRLKLAVAGRGRHALVTTDRDEAVLVGSRWFRGTGSGLGFRDIAWVGDATAWAVESGTGYLLSYRNDAWTVPGASKFEAKVRGRLLEALGARSIDTDSGAKVGSGFRAVAVGRDGRGLAVGAGGAMAKLENGAWSSVHSPTNKLLRAVAVGAGRAVAAGDAGVLLERDSDGWSRRLGVSGLVGNQSFTAVDVMNDGTALAATAGGAVVAQRSSGKAWTRTGLAPLGTKVAKLRGYRDARGALRVLALVQAAGGGQAMLLGDASGWRSVGDSLGLAVKDFDLDRMTGRLWLAGALNGDVVAVRLKRDARGTWVAEAS